MWQEAKQGEVERISGAMICPCIWNQCHGFMVKGIVLPRVGRAEESFTTFLFAIFSLLHF